MQPQRQYRHMTYFFRHFVRSRFFRFDIRLIVGAHRRNPRAIASTSHRRNRVLGRKVSEAARLPKRKLPINVRGSNISGCESLDRAFERDGFHQLLTLHHGARNGSRHIAGRLVSLLFARG